MVTAPSAEGWAESPFEIEITMVPSAPPGIIMMAG
jgi:hypothetical protein